MIGIDGRIQTRSYDNNDSNASLSQRLSLIAYNFFRQKEIKTGKLKHKTHRRLNNHHHLKWNQWMISV